jgi:MSHA biogenesis protein MshI
MWWPAHERGRGQVLQWFDKRRANVGLVAVCPGPQGIAVARVTRGSGGQPSLEWADFIGVEVRSGERQQALAGLARSRGLEGQRATTLLGIGDYSLILVEAPAVPPSELAQAVRWRLKDLVDFNLEQSVVDVFRVPTLKGGQDNMIYAVVARAPLVKSLIDELTAAGIALDVVDIPEFAIRNLTALLPEDVGGVACIHLGDQAGLIVITRQRTLYLSRRFDYGKTRLLAGGAREVTPALEGLLDAIVIEVQRSLDYYESHFAQPPVRAVVLTPLGSEIDGLCEYLGSQLGIATRVLRLADLIEMPGALAPRVESECAGAIGAALRDSAPVS